MQTLGIKKEIEVFTEKVRFKQYFHRQGDSLFIQQSEGTLVTLPCSLTLSHTETHTPRIHYNKMVLRVESMQVQILALTTHYLVKFLHFVKPQSPHQLNRPNSVCSPEW